MKTSERLQKRLFDDLGLEVDTPERIYTGHHQRSAGTWAWSCHKMVGGCHVGSEDTMSECVKAKKLGYFHDRAGNISVCAD